MNDRERFRPIFLPALAAAAALLLAPEAASAYGGPGSIISGVGAFLAALAALAAAVFGFLWFPIKRLMRKMRGGDADEAAGADAREEAAAEAAAE